MSVENLSELLPTIKMLSQVLPGSICRETDEHVQYRQVRPFSAQIRLYPDVLYVVTQELADSFPSDEYACVTDFPMEAAGNHICCPSLSASQILELLLDFFSGLEDWKMQMQQLCLGGAGLDALCRLTEQMLGNPLCIHDDWFLMIGQSPSFSEVMQSDYITSENQGFLPKAITDDFRFDNDYLETYSQEGPGLWHTDGFPDCIFVNLRRENLYRGRMLIFSASHPFRSIDYMLAEAAAQCAIYLLLRKDAMEYRRTRSMDDIVTDLLKGTGQNASEQVQLLNMLQWGREDQLMCLLLRSQQTSLTSVADHLLHGDLFRLFPRSYVLLADQLQCIILNLTRQPISYHQLHYILAPVCRDYCLYIGVSSPVRGIAELSSAYYQAQQALDTAFRLRSEKWIVPFRDCVLEHILEHFDSPLEPRHIISPDLFALQEYDREKGTELYFTLRQYLLHERNIPRASEALIIHRTTLLYRLKKIQSLISADLDDPAQRLYLQLSLWLLDKQGTGI